MKHHKRLTGRRCYDHLGGKLGAILLDFFIAKEWICLDEGKSTVYVLTAEGKKAFEEIGLKF
jgi:hypothetical protein